MTPRAGIVVTGTEVLTGRVTDRNGPWLAERLRDAIPAGRELAAFEMMARVPHPDAASVLTVIGRYHPKEDPSLIEIDGRELWRFGMNLGPERVAPEALAAVQSPLPLP